MFIYTILSMAFKQNLALFIFCCLFAFSQSAWSQEIEVADPKMDRFNARIGPLIVMIGGNVDLDVRIFPQWSIGPSFFGWGGCGNSTAEKKREWGRRCDTWKAFGVRGNYFFTSAFNSGVYIGPGLYHVSRDVSYGYNNKQLTGDFSGTAASTLVGYLYRFSFGLNLSAGVGGLLYVSKPSNVTVTHSSGDQTSISTGPATRFLAELNVGYAF